MLGILLTGLPGCGLRGEDEAGFREENGNSQSKNNIENSSSESSAAGSEGNFTQTIFDISNADIQIGGSQKQGGPLAASLKLEIGYYVKDGKYIAVSVYGDGSESMTPSWIYNYEKQQTAEEKSEE